MDEFRFGFGGGGPDAGITRGGAFAATVWPHYLAGCAELEAGGGVFLGGGMDGDVAGADLLEAFGDGGVGEFRAVAVAA